MQGHLDLEFIRHRHHRLDEIFAVLPHLLFADLAVLREAARRGLGEIEFARQGAAALGHRLVGARPAQPGHEVVADHVDAVLGERFDGPLGVLDLFIAAVQPEFDFLERNRMALHAGDLHAHGGERFLLLAHEIDVLLFARAAHAPAGNDPVQAHLPRDFDVVALRSAEQLRQVEAAFVIACLGGFCRDRRGGGANQRGDRALNIVAAG